MKNETSSTWKINLQNISLIVYDFDGVMTDNKVIISEDGKESVIVNRSDGLAVSILKSMGIRQLILTRETNNIVSARANKLDLPVLKGIEKKATILRRYCRENKIPLKKVIFIGNEMNDADAMRIVGFPLCPQDAYPEAKAAAKFIIPINGGDGVIRDLLHRLAK